jgi:hypothetical protein
MVNYSTHAQPSSSSTFSHFIRSANPASVREVIRLRSREKPHYMTSRVQQPQRDTHFAVLNLNVPRVRVYIFLFHRRRRVAAVSLSTHHRPTVISSRAFSKY